MNEEDKALTFFLAALLYSNAIRDGSPTGASPATLAENSIEYAQTFVQTAITKGFVPKKM